MFILLLIIFHRILTIWREYFGYFQTKTMNWSASCSANLTPVARSEHPRSSWRGYVQKFFNSSYQERSGETLELFAECIIVGCFIFNVESWKKKSSFSYQNSLCLPLHFVTFVYRIFTFMTAKKIIVNPRFDELFYRPTLASSVDRSRVSPSKKRKNELLRISWLQ